MQVLSTILALFVEVYGLYGSVDPSLLLIAPFLLMVVDCYLILYLMRYHSSMTLEVSSSKSKSWKSVLNTSSSLLASPTFIEFVSFSNL